VGVLNEPKKNVDPLPGLTALAHALIDLPWLVYIMDKSLPG